MAARRKKSNQGWINALIVIGLLVVVVSFGKGVVDILTGPPEIDLAADDDINVGFLPAYAAENDVADPEVVALDLASVPTDEPQPGAQAFPTAEPMTPQRPTPTPDPGQLPEQILIPSIGLDATIIPIEFELLQYDGKEYQQWLAPNYRAVGWHHTSVGLGVPGNTVLNGHHNINGEVFRDVYRLEVGDTIHVMSNGQEFDYVIVFTDILPERNQTLEVRLSNSEWIQSTDDERITLITCWPYESNTHRVVVVAVPVRQGSG